MVKSMTGYGRAVETVNGREFTVEIRSVNNRYLDCTVKMPRAFSFAEDAVKQRVKAHVGRGKVDVFITVNAETAQQVQITLNRPVVEGYLNAMRSMVQEYGVTDDISVTALAKMPEVFLVEKPQTDEEQLKADLLSHRGCGAGSGFEKPWSDHPCAGDAGGAGQPPDGGRLPASSGRENAGSAGEQVHRRVPDPNGSSHLCRQGRRG